MVSIIIWSPEAKVTYYNTIKYLLEEWTEKEAKSFIHRVEIVINYISQNPSLYPFSERMGGYRAVITKHISLYYDCNDNIIELLVFWDNRQNPDKLTKAL